jgi:serine/threonine-protein kinase
VYRGADSSGDRDLGPVAVKLLASPPEGRERRRFTNEARVARTLGNPHTVKVYDFGIDEGRPYLVMELLAGKTLRQVLREQGPLPTPRVIAIAMAVCEAIDEAHRRGIVHRDLKPENLMLLAPDHTFVKVLDFGAAGGIAGPEATRSMVGTPRYMAPEQIQEAALDGRVDVYALGVCLYEMLSGRVPFAGPSAMDTMNAHLSEVVPPLVRDDCPPALEQLVMRMLEKAPDARPASLREVEESLRAIAGGGATAPPLQSPRGESAHSMRSFVYAGILASIVLVTGAIGVWRAIATARDANAAADARAQPTAASIAASVAPAGVIPAVPAREPEAPATAAAPARSDARSRPAASPAAVGRPASTASSTAPKATASSPRAGILHENEF